MPVIGGSSLVVDDGKLNGRSVDGEKGSLLGIAVGGSLMFCCVARGSKSENSKELADRGLAGVVSVGDRDISGAIRDDCADGLAAIAWLYVGGKSVSACV